MQDIQPTGEGIGFLGANGGDRRIRQQNYHHQALKCPRCDSVNTKFCYYNNYNLSQPRHFCKKCRRYWTNGGVLRNVPVGGGCRKAKRSSKPKSPSFDTTQPPPPRCERKSNSNSSSESTNLTAAVIATATAASVATEAVSAAPKLLTIHESKSFICQSEKANLKVASHFSKQGSELGIFSEIGSFTSLITSSNDDVLPFGFGNISNDRPFSLLHHDEVIQVQSQHNQWGITDALLNQTIQVDLSDSLHNRSSNVGFASLDFQGSDGDQELFDLPSAVDQAYWNQNQWPTDLHHHHHHHHHDHSNLYLP